MACRTCNGCLVSAGLTCLLVCSQPTLKEVELENTEKSQLGTGKTYERSFP